MKKISFGFGFDPSRFIWQNSAPPPGPSQEQINAWYNGLSPEDQKAIREELSEEKTLSLFNQVSNWLGLGGAWESLTLLFKSDEAIMEMLKAFESKPTTKETLEYHIKLLKALDSPFVPDKSIWTFGLGESDRFDDLGKAGITYFIGFDERGQLVRSNISNFSLIQETDDDTWYETIGKKAAKGGEWLADTISKFAVDSTVTKSVDDLIEYEEKLLESYDKKFSGDTTTQLSSLQTGVSGGPSVTWNRLSSAQRDAIKQGIAYGLQNPTVALGATTLVATYNSRGGIANKTAGSLGFTTWGQVAAHYQKMKQQ